MLLPQIPSLLQIETLIQNHSWKLYKNIKSRTLALLKKTAWGQDKEYLLLCAGAWYFFFFLTVLGTEARTLCILAKCYTTKSRTEVWSLKTDSCQTLGFPQAHDSLGVGFLSVNAAVHTHLTM